MRISLAIIIITLQVQLGLAQTSYNKDIEQCHNNILNLDFDVSQKKINKSNFDENILWHWLKAEHNFIFYLTQTPFQDFSQTLKSIDNAISVFKNKQTNKAEYYGITADLYWYKCFLNFQNKNYLAAITNFNHAKKQIKILETKFTNSPEYTKQHIIYNLISSQIEKQLGLTYKIDKTTLSLIEDIQLKSLSDRNTRELSIIVPYLYYSLTNKATSFKWITNNYYKKGALETFSYSFAMQKTNNYNQYFLSLKKAHENGFNNKLPYLNLLYGTELLNNLNPQGEKIITTHIASYPNYLGTQWALLKLSWYYSATSNKVKEDNTIKQFENTKASPVYLDKQAQYEISNKKNWTPELNKARLLFDAGKYLESKDILLKNKNKLSNYLPEQKLEYTYRLARIYDKLNKLTLAQKFYTMAINSNLDKDFYYPSYAAFYSGKMIMKTDSKQAKTYFNICLKLGSPIYKSSIHKKAKQAINEL